MYSGQNENITSGVEEGEKITPFCNTNQALTRTCSFWYCTYGQDLEKLLATAPALQLYTFTLPCTMFLRYSKAINVHFN